MSAAIEQATERVEAWLALSATIPRHADERTPVSYEEAPLLRSDLEALVSWAKHGPR